MSLWVWTTMPAATGVVQEAGVPARPSISTRQSRQEPKLSSMSVAQSFGISVPGLHRRAHDRGAGGNADGLAVDGQGDHLLGHRGRGAEVDLADQGHRIYSAAFGSGLAPPKSSGKWVSALITGYGVKPPNAQREPNFIV